MILSQSKYSEKITSEFKSPGRCLIVSFIFDFNGRNKMPEIFAYLLVEMNSM